MNKNESSEVDSISRPREGQKYNIISPPQDFASIFLTPSIYIYIIDTYTTTLYNHKFFGTKLQVKTIKIKPNNLGMIR